MKLQRQAGQDPGGLYQLRMEGCAMPLGPAPR